MNNLRFVPRLLLVAVAALAACAPTPAPTPPRLTGPRFTDADAGCPWSLAEARADLPGSAFHCGTVNVPEFHHEPAGPQLQLAVLVAQRDPLQASPDAILYLAGGPGNRVQPGLLSNFSTAGRDVIIFDQRGVGLSTPALNCLAVGSRDPFSAASDALPALAACRTDLLRQGIHLAAYTLPEAAADVEDIRQALGYQQLDLYGLSYGTKLALTVMRDFPQAARSAVLDSVLPAQANVVADLPAGLQRSLNLVFEACAADADCRAAHPDLRAAFSQLLDQLNQHPAMLHLNGATARFGSASLVRLLLPLLLDGPEQLPGFVQRLRQNDLSQVSQMLAELAQPTDSTAWVMSFSVVCSDDHYSLAPASAAGSASLQPELRGPLSAVVQAVVSLCDGWPAPKLPAASAQPVYSSVPTLILEGTFDPITPPAYGRLAAATLTDSFYVEFPDRGHGVLRGGDDCSLQMVNQFFQRPRAAPDVSCATALRPVFDARPTGKFGAAGFVLSRDAMLAAAAPVVRLTVAQLDQALGAGQSLATVAEDHHVAGALVKAALRAEIQAEVDAQVQAGQITLDDAAVIMLKFDEGGLDELMNSR